MINIQEEIKVLLLRKGLSMRKLLKRMAEKGYETFSISGLSTSLQKRSIKFDKVQEILDFLGYELEIKPKK